MMQTWIHKIYNLSGGLGMYQVVLYGLILLLVGTELLASLDIIGVSAAGIALSALILTLGCYLANKSLSYFLRVPTNYESWLITALILVFIVPPVESVERGLLVLLCGIIAIASKFFIVWRGSHIFNPAAFGAFAVSVTGLLPITWWVATPYLLPFVGLLALRILQKQREFTLFSVFALTAVGMLLLNGLVFQNHGQTIAEILRSAALSWPIVYMGSIMLTEPLTMPATRQYRLMFALLVGIIFGAQMSFGPLSTTPQFALLMGNIFAVLMTPPVGAMVKLRRVNRLADDIVEVVLEKPKGWRFMAGQYVEMTLPHVSTDIRGNRRTLSIASGPHEDDLRFALRTFKPGSSFKRALIGLKPGTKVRLAKVAGSFVLPRSANVPIALIAGGIGITPYRSIIADLLAKGQRRDVILVYIASSVERFVYKDLFEKAAVLGVKTEYVVGRLSGDALNEMVPDLLPRTVYISGPEKMVSGYKRALQKSGLKRSRIHTDHFIGY